MGRYATSLILVVKHLYLEKTEDTIGNFYYHWFFYYFEILVAYYFLQKNL